MTIGDWLQSDRDYGTGLQLLEQNGGSSSLLTILAKETTYNRKRVARELLKIADQEPVAPPDKPKPQPALSQRAENKSISTSQWPEPLHPAVERLQNLYQLVNHLHPQMDSTYNINRKQAFEIKCKVQDSWQEINEIWRLLNYFSDHKVVLPNIYNPDERHLPFDRAQLVKRRNNLRTYLSRDKHKVGKAEKVKAWQEELNEINTKLGDVV
jgi:hypothetical protein